MAQHQNHLHVAVGLLLAGLLYTSAARSEGVNVATAPSPTPTAVNDFPLKIKQVNVIDRASPSSTRCVAIAPAGAASVAHEGAIQDPDAAWRAAPSEAQVLQGAGDIEVIVGQETYRAERDQSNKSAKPSHLFVNGVNMGDAAKLIAQLSCGADVHLRYRIVPAENSQKLWGALYRSSGLTTGEPLNVAIGWDDTGPRSEQSIQVGVRNIAVTNAWSVAFAFLAVVVLGIFTGLVFFYTDAFRDVPAPWWSKEAKRLLRLRRRANLTADDVWLKQMYADYDPAKAADYDAAATRASAGKLPEDGPQEWVTLFGLLRTGKVPRRILGPFSLARTQLGMWFFFAVASGVFLWIVYGQLPKIENSLLLLLGLSVGTAGVSLAIDKSNSDATQPFSSSRGLLNDLVIGGKDDKEQVYRYQAVVVNLLLLFVGITHVVQNLSYPMFDATWLAFLGISGAALTVGKQISETPKVPPA